jgi:hypothetical protein
VARTERLLSSLPLVPDSTPTIASPTVDDPRSATSRSTSAGGADTDEGHTRSRRTLAADPQGRRRRRRRGRRSRWVGRFAVMIASQSSCRRGRIPSSGRSGGDRDGEGDWCDGRPSFVRCGCPRQPAGRPAARSSPAPPIPLAQAWTGSTPPGGSITLLQDQRCSNRHASLSRTTTL